MNAGKTFIGRSGDNHIMVEDDGVSKQHTMIESDAGQWWITDLGSRNGVYVNGTKIDRKAMLAPESVVKIGTTLFMFELVRNGNRTSH